MLCALQFLLDEGVAVEPVGGMEGKEAGDAHDDRPQDFVPDVEVVVGEAAPLDAPGCDGSDPGWDIWERVMRKVRPCSMLLKMK